VTRRDKLTPAGFHAEIEELFSELWHVPRFAGRRRGFRPDVDSYRTEDPPLLTVIVELPGVDVRTLTIAISERTLLVAGERSRDRPDGRVYQQMEIDYGPFQRQVLLGEDVDAQRATARYEAGMLTISLPIAGKAALGRRFVIVVERT
jgi:HSP20 family protein